MLLLALVVCRSGSTNGYSALSNTVLGIGDLQMLLGECLGAESPFSQNYLVSCCIDIQWDLLTFSLLIRIIYRICQLFKI